VRKKDPLQPDRCAELLGALAAPERLKIVRFLLEGEHTVTEIADMLEVPIVNASHHLQVLKISRLIQGKKDGRFVRYSTRPSRLAYPAMPSTWAAAKSCSPQKTSTNSTTTKSQPV
jgi:DNA-binding transcriptional ArsR family regulator